jgi:hypothetical protein
MEDHVGTPDQPVQPVQGVGGGNAAADSPQQGVSPAAAPGQGAAPAQAAAEQIIVQQGDIEIPRSDSVFIKSASLANQLVRHQDETLRFLSEQVSPIDVDQISVDSEGRVVVANQQFRETLLVVLQSAAPESVNLKCVNIYKCLVEEEM